MKRPSFQFYPDDWTGNANLRRCSPAARGVWVDVMCLMHDQEEYGVLRWPLKDIAQAAGASMSHVRELVEKHVLKGIDKGECEPFVYVPRSGRKDGDPVTLVPTQTGPIWYSSRMVKDEYVRTIRAESGGNGGAPKGAPKPPFGDAKGEPKGGGFGPRASPSPSPIPPPEEEEATSGEVATARRSERPAVPDCPHLDILALWAEVLPSMPQHMPEHWGGARADHLRARWRETAVARKWSGTGDGLAYFRKLFGYIAGSDFLTGNVPAQQGRRPFVIELEWLVLPSNWAKVHEGKYHHQEAA